MLKRLAKSFDVSTDYLLDYRPDCASSFREVELLRIFRALPPEQHEICVEQCRVFLKLNRK